MIRIVLENLFLFLLPTLAYLSYIAYQRNDWPGLWKVLAEAPLVQLFVTGAFLMIATLLAFSSASGHRPGEAYTPPSYQDGKLLPGHGANDSQK
ncbi:MAG: hypothetical protein KDJ17_03320 [Hyphomicrobiaceae bacterium]|nr:hypothetical protein [Hyphomicrobiaceae bacterium]